MDKKGVYRTKKRKFNGNRYIKTNHEVVYNSTSGKKLKLSSGISHQARPNNSTKTAAEYNKCTKNPVGYRFIDVELLGVGLRNSLNCKFCGGDVFLIETNVRGLGSKLVIQCEQCEPSNIGEFYTSKTIPKTNQAYEVNRRAVYAMRTVGVGLTGLKRFCGVMNMLPPVGPTTYRLINSQIARATKMAGTESMKQAVFEEVRATNTDSNTDITVSGDGTWMKRGHTSLMGVCSVIGANCSKVIDIDVLSSFCHGCSTWKGPKTGQEYTDFIIKHRESGKCTKNHFGSAGSMEVKGIMNIFHRSQDRYGVRYTNYIGDGDTSTYHTVAESKPYGPDVPIIKEECIGHIQKRMSTRLRTLKKVNKHVELSDGKKIGGKNRLTDTLIDQLAVYYGNAIRGNTNNLQSMIQAVWATWNHKASSDTEPLHHFCPKGPESWCKYQQAVSNKTAFHHTKIIPKPIMDFIKPVFMDLSKPELLQRCLKGKTQNANESFNNVLWSICPKRGFAGKTVVEIAAYEAALIYNKGCIGRMEVLSCMDIVPGKHCEESLRKCDERRVFNADKRATMETLESRRARRRLRLDQESHFEEIEGVTYAAGEF